MADSGNIDSVLRALGGKYARYQMFQMLAINVGLFGVAYQLLDNIFIGRAVSGQRCAAPPGNLSVESENVDNLIHNITHLDAYEHNATIVYEYAYSSLRMKLGKCHITLDSGTGNRSLNSRTIPCLYGYEYGYPRELSFRTEFDLVCDRKLLGGLAQSLLMIGQGVGAVLTSLIADRFGRKRTIVSCQFGMFLVGIIIGLAPSFAVFGTFKFLVGAIQQGSAMGIATMSIELYPTEHRSLVVLVGGVFWAVAATSMALVAFLLQHQPWRYLQYALSAVSLIIAAFQLWYLDDSLRWLVTNGRQEASRKVLERAATTNGVDIQSVMARLNQDHRHAELNQLTHVHLRAVNGRMRTMPVKPTEKLTLLDLFRYRALLTIGLVIWFSWFTCAFSFFALYMMSTSLVGNRFLNYFLTALMELPPCVLNYFLVDRSGRKTTTRALFVVAGAGLIASGVCRLYAGIPAVGTLSVIASMVGMFGASGMFGCLFFYTPELFPTNFRTQALGVASSVGRLGGMLSPFMTNLAEVSVWAPGAMTGGLCFVVAALLHFLPETRGRELPHTVEDVQRWGTHKASKYRPPLRM